ncbi:MAG: M20 family metallopeptidase [Acetobacteraceae bacterium]|nr:M20 family metallopeptidase [Acetobacteraceae bacterium]
MPTAALGTSEDLLRELASWVELETPTTDAAAVDRLMDRAAASLAGTAAALTWIPGRDGYGGHLLARLPGGNGAPILVLGHLDTVWSTGTLASMPFRIEGDRAYGPGIYDMKASSLIALHAFRCFARQGVAAHRPITLLLTSDEEIGSPTSRALIEREAAASAYALVLEPAAADGACVTARKGVGRFHMQVEGKASHAGNAFLGGASAVVELARQIVTVNELVDAERGITLNVAPIRGGTRPNVIAAEAACEIDLRVPDAESGAVLERRLLALSAQSPGCRVRVTGGMNRPPWAENAAGIALYERARAIATALGFALPKQSRGGGSDANFTATVGTPTLDGIGCPGHGAHASDEHILWRELAPRAALLARLLETLD